MLIVIRNRDGYYRATDALGTYWTPRPDKARSYPSVAVAQMSVVPARGERIVTIQESSRNHD